MENWKKYEKTYFMPPEPCYDWVKKDSIDKALWVPRMRANSDRTTSSLLFLVVISFGLADGQGLSPTSGCRNVPAKPAAAQMKQDSAR